MPSGRRESSLIRFCDPLLSIILLELRMQSLLDAESRRFPCDSLASNSEEIVLSLQKLGGRNRRGGMDISKHASVVTRKTRLA